MFVIVCIDLDLMFSLPSVFKLPILVVFKTESSSQQSSHVCHDSNRLYVFARTFGQQGFDVRERERKDQMRGGEGRSTVFPAGHYGQLPRAPGSGGPPSSGSPRAMEEPLER